VGRNLISLSGKRFGRLLVTDTYEVVKKHTMWLCLCDCGVTKKVSSENLRSGRTTSCGCFQRESENNPAYVHGESKRSGATKERVAYQSAKTRCTNPNFHAYKEYGGRGIKFLFISFKDFLEDVGRAPSPSHSLDRINVDGNYESGNLRWSTPAEQIRNRRKFKALTGFSTEEIKEELRRREENVRSD
jgi:hypothetical protein